MRPFTSGKLQKLQSYTCIVWSLWTTSVDTTEQVLHWHSTKYSVTMFIGTNPGTTLGYVNIKLQQISHCGPSSIRETGQSSSTVGPHFEDPSFDLVFWNNWSLVSSSLTDWCLREPPPLTAVLGSASCKNTIICWLEPLFPGRIRLRRKSGTYILTLWIDWYGRVHSSCI